MDLITAEEKLSEYSADIYSCIINGFSNGYLFLKERKHILTSTTQSNIIRDFIIEEARNTFSCDMIHRGRGNIILLKTDGYLIRFKKFDKRKLARNVKTSQALNYSNQINIPGIQPSVHLNAGYILDETKSSIDNVYITCPSSLYSNNWIINLRYYIENNNKIPLPPIVELVENINTIKISVKKEAVQNREFIKTANE